MTREYIIDYSGTIFYRLSIDIDSSNSIEKFKKKIDQFYSLLLHAA